MTIGPSTLDDPRSKKAILQAIRAEPPYRAELGRVLSEDWMGPQASSTLVALATMLREEDVVHLRQRTPGPEIRVFRALWRSGLFEEAREFGRKRSLGIVPSPPAVISASGPQADPLPKEEGFGNAETLSEWGIWGVSDEALRFASKVATQGTTPRAFQNDILLTGPAGTETLNVARALHGLRERGRFELLDCSTIQSDPGSTIGSIVGGTVFLEHLEQVPKQWERALFDAVVARSGPLALPALDGTRGSATTPDTQFIMAVTDPNTAGIVESLYRQGVWRELRISPLIQRSTDIPLLVNQILRGLTDQGPLVDGRHRFAVALWEFHEQHRPEGEDAWLRSEVRRWVEELSPGSLIEARIEDSRLETPSPLGDADDEPIEWKDVIIEVASNDSVRVRVPKRKPKVYHYADLNFIDRRKGDMPDTRWGVLLALLRNEGVITDDEVVREIGRSIDLKAAVREIRRRLRSALEIAGDPIEYSRKKGQYEAAFQAQDKPIAVPLYIGNEQQDELT
jgi:hypothetical protein